MPYLEEIDNVTISGGNTTSNLYGLEKVNTINWISGDVRNFFNSCSKLIEVKKIVLPTNVTNASQFGFKDASSLRYIGEINTIKLSMFNLSGSSLLGKESLIRMLNALYDYAAEGSTNTYTLTLGTTNLAKLTEEEQAIATDKGWTLV